jgi:hypothetical protein
VYWVPFFIQTSFNLHTGLVILIFVIILISGCNPENSLPTDDLEITPTDYHQIESPSQPSPTSPPIPSATSEPSAENIFLVFDGFWHNEVYVLEFGSRELSLVYQIDAPDAAFWGLSSNRCNLFVGPQNVAAGSVLAVDFAGEIQYELTAFDYPVGVVDQVYVSPDEIWVAYVVGRWVDSETDPDVFDLHVSPADSPDQVEQISVNGGVTSVAWLNESDQFVFSADDRSGVQQVFNYAVEEQELLQVTEFNDPEIKINEISVSPDGEDLVIITRSRSTSRAEILKIDISQGFELRAITSELFQSAPVYVIGIWWDNENTIITKLSFDDTSDLQDGLYWIDLRSLEVLKVVDLDPIFGEFWSGDPFGDKIMVGTPFPHEHSIFDLATEEIVDSIEMSFDFNSFSHLLFLPLKENVDCN